MTSSERNLRARPFLGFVHPDDRMATRARFDRSSQGSEAVLFESRFHHRDGSYRWLRWLARPLPGRHRVYAIARDVTRQKRLEREILEVADRQKERLGRELHDGLCQTLAGIAALSTTLARRLAKSPQTSAAAAAGEITRLLGEAIGEARNLARGLGPLDLRGGDLAAALAAIGESAPDLVVVDLELDCSSGLDLVKEMKRRHPEIPALGLSMHDEAVYAERSLRAGARGDLTRRQLDETVLVAIRRLLAGETYMSAALERRLAARFVSGRTLATDSPLDVLADRELEVFRLIGRGRTTRQIAADLHLSPNTIESHREHIKHKLGLESAAQLARRATQWVETGRKS